MKYFWIMIIAMFFVGCGSNVRDGCHIEGNLLVCPKDGTSVVINNPGQVGPQGEQGVAGLNGSDGLNGQNGNNGQDAVPCTVTETTNGAMITCPDGSSVEIYDGTNGTDGSSTVIVCHNNEEHSRVCIEHNPNENQDN